MKLVIDMNYYNYDNIDKLNATYNLIIGQRSNGKTFGWCRKAIDAYLEDGIPSAYIRRHDEQIRPTNISNLFHPHTNYIERKTKGKYNAIIYRLHSFYLARYENTVTGAEKKVAQDKNPFCRTYAISTAETTKGADAGELKYICFDEFMTRRFYLNNEFVLFQNLLSSLIRNRSGVKIYMLANTVNKYCPYFADMGLRNVAKQKQGTIDVYQMGKSDTTIAVEYCNQADVAVSVSKYFAFDNPQLEMISTGAWEIALYRHAPIKISDYRVILSFFILFDGSIVQGDIHMYNGYPVIMYHWKTTPVKDPERSIMYIQDTIDGNPLHQVDLRVAPTKAQKLILDLMHYQKAFYADNEVGEHVNNWMKYSMKSRNNAHI